MAERTLRQRLMETLRTGDESFEGLCYSLRVRRRELEAELRHVERTARSGGERLIVTPAVCETCGFVFRGRIPRHLQPPGRCPACKGERIADPLFRLEAAAS
jgi:predicted Zn-ribbon and HTH transcriptional regulator